MMDLVATVTVIVLAACTGLMFGIRIEPPFRWAGSLVGAVIVGVVVAAGVLIAGEPAWTGPLFAVLTGVVAVLGRAEAWADDPRFAAEKYLQRVRLVVSLRSGRQYSESHSR